jgi:DNA invertase Pin-like site-specific DNA recombinase
MEEARREGWALHFADLDIDTSTPAGEMAANIIISGSQYERRLISQRTRDALAGKRARGERLGAPPPLPIELTRRIIIHLEEEAEPNSDDHFEMHWPDRQVIQAPANVGQ